MKIKAKDIKIGDKIMVRKDQEIRWKNTPMQIENDIVLTVAYEPEFIPPTKEYGEWVFGDKSVLLFMAENACTAVVDAKDFVEVLN